MIFFGLDPPGMARLWFTTTPSSSLLTPARIKRRAAREIRVSMRQDCWRSRGRQ